MFKIQLREVVSKAVRKLGVVRRVGRLFDCPSVLEICFNAYVFSSLKQCAPVWMSSAESAAHNTRASATLGELALVISRCRTDKFRWSFLLAAVNC